MPADIQAIREKIANDQFEFSKHAVDQMIRRRIRVHQVREVIAEGEVIEDYPDDKYGPNCLILGATASGQPVHVQCTYPSRPLVKVITVYQPDPTLWGVDLKSRRVNEPR